MIKDKAIKKPFKEIVKNTVDKVIKKEVDKLQPIRDKRNTLINEIKGKLMSNGALKRGGGANRVRYAQEVANYAPIIEEINDLGRQLKFRDIGLGNLRG